MTTGTSDTIMRDFIQRMLHPDRVPPEASFAAVTAGAQVRVLTIGPLPNAVMRMVPRSATDRRLPDVATVTTHSDDT